MIQRYAIDYRLLGRECKAACITKHENGDYVTYRDHAAALAAKDAEIAEVKGITLRIAAPWIESFTLCSRQCSEWQDRAERAEQEAAGLRADVAELLSALHDAISQACEDKGEYDSMGLSAYCDAMDVLEKHGRIKITHNVGRRSIAVDAARAGGGE